MPIHAVGSYTARIAEGDRSFIDAQPATFTYLPVRSLVWAIWIGMGLGMLWLMRRFDRNLSASRYWVLVPGLIGAVTAIIAGTIRDTDANGFLLFFSTSVQILSVSFVLWRVLRVRSSFLAAAILFGVGICVFCANMILFEIGGLPFFVVVIYSAMAGPTLGFPPAAIRFAVRKGVTWGRLVIGFLIGAGVPSIVLTIFMWNLASQTYYLFVLYSFLLTPALVFCVLVRWNSWARAVATGELFRSPEPPTESEVASPAK
jgi:hypothetical protein